MEHSKELGEFMKMKGANSLGILMLTTGLSKAYMCLDKYLTLLKELKRHMDYHLDRQDIREIHECLQKPFSPVSIYTEKERAGVADPDRSLLELRMKCH